MSVMGPNLEVRLVSRDVGTGIEGRDVCRFIIDMPNSRYGRMAFAYDCDWVAEHESGLDLGKAALTIGAEILDKLAEEMRCTADYGDPFAFNDRTQV